MAVTIVEKTTCCGCASCVSICPTKALSMSKDYKGFYYPHLDNEGCLNCGKCERVCPIQNLSDGIKVNKAFAAWTKVPNPQSTSGGVAYQVSKEFVLRGGVVYGCASSSGKVRHIRVENPEEVKVLCGSKYVQSDMSSVYELIREDLNQGNRVLFVGVPCQAYAVKNYFKSRHQNLYLMDILCHGVPSQQMLDEHIATFSKGRTVESISFRDGEEYCLSVSGKGWNRKARFLHDSFIAGFLNSVSLRESCMDCQFAGDIRYSDVTVGDFWGLGSEATFEYEHPTKVSLVIPSTEKGMELLSMVKDGVVIYERSAREAIDGNYPLRGSAKPNTRYKLFSMLYRIVPFGHAVTLSILDIYVKKPFHMLQRLICKRK